MSIGRSIEKQENGLVVGGHRQKQAVRVFLAAQSVPVVPGYLWRFGLPVTVAGASVVLGELLVGVGG